MFMLRTNGALCLDSLEKDSMKLRMLMRMYRKPVSRAAAVRMAEHVGRGGGRLEELLNIIFIVSFLYAK